MIRTASLRCRETDEFVRWNPGELDLFKRVWCHETMPETIHSRWHNELPRLRPFVFVDEMDSLRSRNVVAT